MYKEPFSKLADDLRRDILQGRYGEEGGLPSVSEKAKEYGITVNTARLAFVFLMGEGVIEHRSSGYYVKKREDYGRQQE